MDALELLYTPRAMRRLAPDPIDDEAPRPLHQTRTGVSQTTTGPPLRHAALVEARTRLVDALGRTEMVDAGAPAAWAASADH